MSCDSKLYIDILQIVSDYKDPISTAGINKLMTGTSRGTVEVYTLRLTREGYLKATDTKIFDDGKYQIGRTITEKGRKHLANGPVDYPGRSKQSRDAKAARRTRPMTTTELGDKLKAALPKPATPTVEEMDHAETTGNILFCVLKGRHDDGTLNFLEFAIIAGSQQEAWLRAAAKLMKCQVVTVPDEDTDD